MIRFANIEFLYALLIIPGLILIYIYLQKNRNKILEKFADSKLHNILFPLKSNAKAHLKFALFTFSLMLILIALANPQVGTKIEEVKQIGIDVYILLDVSKSMLAEDIKPSRLEKAKYEISKLIQRLKGDRIGLIVFAGEAYVQIPLTSDYSAANLFLNAVDVNSVPQPGTAIAPAIKLALKSFKYDDGTKKAIVIITDGEDHQGELESVLDEANSKEVAIYAIGFGSPAGVPIPIYNEAGVQVGYKKDNQGNIVLTRLNEEILKQITSKCNGKYYRGTNTEDELEAIYNDLAKIEQSEYGSKRITEYEDRFYYFLFPAILLLIIDFFISSNKSSWLARLEKLRGEQK
ncbi:MAG: VWA domain-containing protein [Melioribacter sp.]|uniref:VWA domain-containing protein n=1 Tax=Rosettibacter primus TaxID=3111523 RepID=UPI00247EA252|nr:VWA domain-containing protein [Melioribacter sp.]